MEPDPILPYIQFEEEGIFGSTGHTVSDAYPSTASSSTGESSDPRMVWSATRILGSSNTSRDWMQQQESSPAFADDLDATGVISPQIEQDLLQSDPFTELAQPDHEGFLNPFFEPGNTFTRNHNNAPPWAHYDELDTNHVHRRAYGPETVYLNVPTYVDRLGSRATTPGGPSDTASAVSSENVNTRLETRPRRGGRQSGMNLSRESVQNIRRCSEGKPCISCSSTQGRKWDGCVRSFKELVDVFKPEILATRLQPQALTGFMSYHTLRRYGQDDFDLPLHFGFGRPFYGFKGAEYNPMTTEIQFSHVVGPSDQHPESALYGYSLPKPERYGRLATGLFWCRRRWMDTRTSPRDVGIFCSILENTKVPSRRTSARQKPILYMDVGLGDNHAVVAGLYSIGRPAWRNEQLAIPGGR
ncbi:hypothetical protein UA08_08289 [Talaromyces atroroseus]|uniref:Uncharacterized protein n=1 Tax=Talaromyces atroroseus TaxID=1441469 RepID=A0A225ANW6_TALAT|nr:hypothetical protein UA08_08289 [Talaromyces atroroseus]OKL56656.1 hypothetical protein UA08_08289 [Talaromyces atroroseus]